MHAVDPIANYLPKPIQIYLEQTYYAKVNTQAHLDQLAHDQAFLAAPERHVGFFSDHGVVHVRDVAHQVLRVLAVSHGVLIPARTPYRLEFMKGYGVMVAYLHDIGMLDFSTFGRAMHPEFAAQSVYTPTFDECLQTLWAQNCGNVAWRLLRLATQDILPQPPELVLRELLAMSIAHSKSKVPIAVLNDPAQLRSVMQTAVSTDLRVLYQQQQVAKARKSYHQAKLGAIHHADHDQSDLTRLAQALGQEEAALAKMLTSLSGSAHTGHALGTTPAGVARHYTDLPHDAFAWLGSAHPALRDLVMDVTDTLRALRCADALRQRGTVLNTSGGYQIFVDARTAGAIHAFKKGVDEMLLLLETSDAIAAGEANVAGSELTKEGDLRISFHRGSFATPETVHHAAHSAALIANDIQADVISSFQRPTAAVQGAPSALKSAAEMQILLEGVDDNLAFAAQVGQALASINPQLQGRISAVPSLQNVSERERARYLNGRDPGWDGTEKQRLLAKIAESGHKVGAMDADLALAGVKLVQVDAGEVLIEAGSPPGFVYIALAAGLTGTPLGGYQPFPVYPWTPLGNTSIIRGAARNATIVANAALHVLMVPKDVYLQQWHHTYNKQEFRQKIREIYA